MVWVTAAAALSVVFLAIGSRGRRSRSIDRLRELDDAVVEEVSEARAGFASSVIELPIRLIPSTIRRRLFGRLAALCDSPGLTVPRLAGIQVWAAVGLPVCLVFLSGFSTVSFVLAPAVAAIGLLLPRLISARARARHMEAIRKALPDTADILYALVLGGKNLDQAFKYAAAQAPEPLSPYLRGAVREMGLGSTRAEAFERLAERCPLRELKSLLCSLLESEKRGYSLSSTLSVFSREIRLRRRDQLREAGAKAPLKMLAPLVFLILPASVLLTVGPTFLATLQRVF